MIKVLVVRIWVSLEADGGARARASVSIGKGLGMGASRQGRPVGDLRLRGGGSGRRHAGLKSLGSDREKRIGTLARRASAS